jgi:fucose permease
MAADRGPATSAVTIIFVVIATIFVAARFFTRAYLVRSLKQDDWWILAAWMAAGAFSASICVGVHYGLGLHSQDVGSVARHEALRKAEYAFSVLYNPCLLLTKTSIIVFYLSVMSKDVDPIFKWCNWLTLAVVNVAGVALTFLSIFQCRPIRSGFLYPTPENSNCTDIVTLYLSSAPVNIITDLAILFLPMPILTGMRLPRKQKIILVVTFSFGAFVAVVDVVRIAYLQNASRNRLEVVNSGSHQSQPTREQDDFSWYASFSFMWSAVEVNLGIICACVPSLKPLLMRFMPNFVRDTGDEFSPTGTRDDDSPTGALKAPALKGNVSILTNPAAFRKPMVQEYAGDDEGDAMGFLNMLAVPDDDAPVLKSAMTRISRMSTRRNAQSASDFGFVTMDRTRNMLKLSNRQCIWPIAVVTFIFFLWGLAYGLLDTLNAKFQAVADVSTREGLALHASYYGGYFVGPLTLGQFMLRRYGFKATMMAGLCVYGCGTLVFWPSAVLTSYTAFVISNFIVAFGLSCLEIAANPYIALCGPLEYAEARLNFSQGVQAIGTIVSPLLAQKVLFKDTRATALVDVQWAYLAIALFVIALAVVFYYIPLPEASDEQLQAMADRRSAVYRTKIGPYRVIWWTLVLGVFSQWCYVGGQEVIGGTTQPLYNIINTARPDPSSLSAFDYQTVSHTVYMAGRFLSAYLNYALLPRKILLVLYTGLIICCALQMSVDGIGALVVNQLIYLFESGIFSTIFAITMRGMGEHTKMASALMTAAISGGAVFPVIQWATENRHTLKFSFVVPVIVFAFGWIFPIYLNAVPAARNQVQPTHENRTQRRAARAQRKPERRENEMGNLDPATRHFGLAGIIVPSRRAKALQANEGTAQHIEGQGQADQQSTLSPSSPFGSEMPDLPATPNVVKLRRPSGIVGGLKPWPGLPDDSSDKETRMETSGADGAAQDAITRHRPVFDEKDEDNDDYHMFLRGR